MIEYVTERDAMRFVAEISSLTWKQGRENVQTRQQLARQIAYDIEQLVLNALEADDGDGA